MHGVKHTMDPRSHRDLTTPGIDRPFSAENVVPSRTNSECVAGGDMDTASFIELLKSDEGDFPNVFVTLSFLWLT